ncbi:MAG: type IV secretory system conjugative DNA transfer family protein [Candidatus Eisenbacteria bacterium]|nr:type IV secretory system conjugative DNA transfer family protein [Candidatus Eisenbacteria bacterium]
MLASSIERLTEQFYTWERRGRGWRVWDSPVELEPPFAPFRFHHVSRSPSDLDDGRVSTLWSRLTDRILGAGPSPADESEHAVLDEEDSEPGAIDDSEPLTELRWSLPPDHDVSPEEVEQFLLALPHLRRSVTFEVIGTAEAIAVQLVCAEADRSLVQQQVRGFFPASVLTTADGSLETAWQQQGGHSVVVEFGLSEEFMLPLRTLRRFTVDPLTGIGAAMSELEPGETAVLQVLFQPTREPWAESILRAVLDEGGSPFFLDAPEVTALAREKISRPLYACVVRVGVRSPDPQRAMLLARSVGWALNALTNPPANRLVPLANDDYPDEFHEQDLLRRLTRRSGMLLSCAELVSLVHPPSATVRLEKLVRESGKTRMAPAVATNHDYVLGTNMHAGKSTPVALSDDQRSRHLYVVGASGTGKSTLLLSLILQSLDRGEGLAVLDPHGDLIDEVVRRLPASRRDDVVLLDPSDGEYPVGFNILQAHSELERTLLASDLVSVFRRLSTSWGDQMTSVLGNAILAFLESGRGGTLVDLRRFLVEADFRREFLKTVNDSEVVYYWQKEFPLLSGKPQAPLLTRLDIFLRPKTIRYMVAQQDSRLDLRRIMDGGQVLLARLSQGAIGEENAYLLGTLIVSKLQQLAMSRQEQAAAERRPFYLYVDEFHNFVTPSMESILSGARKYRLGLVLAHQDLRQIQSRSVDVLNSVLSNPYARICFRVGDQDARTLADGFQHFDARDLQSLSTGQAIARIERSEFDFNLATTMLPLVDEAASTETRAHIVGRTRERYGRPRAEIEALLARSGAAQELESKRVEPPTPPSPPRRERAGAESPAVPAPLLPPSAVEIPTPASSPGRGGKQHKYLQSLICRWADTHDWRSTVEESVLDGLGNVDVALRKGEKGVAVEIGVTTSSDHEVENLQKCLAAGFGRVLHVAADQKTLKTMKRESAAILTEEQLGKVAYCTPENLFDVLDAADAETHVSEQTVRGYKVKVRIKPTTSATKTERHGVVSAVVAQAVKRMRKSKS